MVTTSTGIPMRRILIVSAAVLVLSACTTRATRSQDDLWDAKAGNSEAAAFMGYHGRVERSRAVAD